MTEAVAMHGIVKHFPGVLANDHVDLFVEKGEVRAIVGENGAGKTTLMRILYGLETPDAGTIRVKGREVVIASARAAIALGIGMVHQHFKLVPSFTVAQNVVLGVEPRRGIVYDEQAAQADVLALSERYGLAVDPERKILDASVGEQQRVEILRALHRKADILILDEPTAVLTDQETEELFAILRRLADDGLTILFISHKLREVLAISDNTTVMRDGHVVGTVQTAKTSDGELSEMMIGRETLGTELRHRKTVQPGEPVLQLDSLSVFDSRGILAVHGVDLTVRSGEIVGIAGVEGNGQVELAEAVTGLRKVADGSIRLDGREIQNQSVRAIREAGVAHIPADRHAMGVSVEALVWENLCCTRYYESEYSGRMALSFDSILSDAQSLVSEFDVRTPTLQCPARNLSGGNMQKLVVARELGADHSRLVVAAQPTRGIDIAGTEAIRCMLVDYASQGAGVLLISADLDEILAISDRVVVMYGGRLTDAGKVDASTREKIGRAMTGTSVEGVPEAEAQADCRLKEGRDE
jgi:simple sugar transport system ATP-binding protein